MRRSDSAGALRPPRPLMPASSLARPMAAAACVCTMSDGAVPPYCRRTAAVPPYRRASPWPRWWTCWRPARPRPSTAWPSTGRLWRRSRRRCWTGARSRCEEGARTCACVPAAVPAPVPASVPATAPAPVPTSGLLSRCPAWGEGPGGGRRVKPFVRHGGVEWGVGGWLLFSHAALPGSRIRGHPVAVSAAAGPSQVKAQWQSDDFPRQPM